MEFTYDKVNKELTITGIDAYSGGDNAYLYINDKLIESMLDDEVEYTFTSDGIYKIDIVILDSDDEELTRTTNYQLVIEYSKDKNRALLVSILDNTSYKGLGTIYVNNRKLISEIENSYSASIPERCSQLIDSLKW